MIHFPVISTYYIYGKLWISQIFEEQIYRLFFFAGDSRDLSRFLVHLDQIWIKKTRNWVKFLILGIYECVSNLTKDWNYVRMYMRLSYTKNVSFSHAKIDVVTMTASCHSHDITLLFFCIFDQNRNDFVAK